MTPIYYAHHFLWILLGSVAVVTGGSTQLQEQEATTTQQSRLLAATPSLIPSIESSLVFEGAFRLRNGVFGASSIDYAVGALAYNPDRHSLFIVGHAHQSAIAEYPIADTKVNVDAQVLLQDLPQTDAPLQGFELMLGKVSNPEARDRITGMLVVDGALYVNAETWYNPGGVSRDTTLYVSNANNLGAASSVSGWFEMTGASQSAGYMGEIPPEFQSLFGGSKYYSGWSTVYSGLSQYSVGPSFWTFSPSDMRRGGSGRVDATAWMNYDFSGGSDQWLTPRALDWGQQGTAGPYAPSDPLWNPLSKGVYGFFVPNSRTWCVIGSTAGLTSGIGNQAVQSNGNVCGGPCPYDPNDTYNYYWLYDVQEIASASNVWEVRPYAYGKWDLPYATIPEDHRIIGGTIGAGKLYIALANAGKVGDYDQPPLILTFQLPDGPAPTTSPTFTPTHPPTAKPTTFPTTSLPSPNPTLLPTTVPSSIFTSVPSSIPSPLPTKSSLSPTWNAGTQSPTRNPPLPTLKPNPLPSSITTAPTLTQTPLGPGQPLQRASISALKYRGAFRLRNGFFGESSIDYAIGTLAYNPDRHSLFLAGHAQHAAIAEFAIVPPYPSTKWSDDNHENVATVAVADLPETDEPLQRFVRVLDRLGDNPQVLDRITGMLVVDGVLYVNAERWYDAGAQNTDTSLIISDANDLEGSTIRGFYGLTGGAQSAGYMGVIPPILRSLFRGSTHYTGWSSVYSIVSRYSLGPSFWSFSPSDMLQGGDPPGKVAAIAWMNFPYRQRDSGAWLSPRATEWEQQGIPGPFPPADPLWNPLSKGMYGFFIPNSRTWCVIGSTGGLSSGIGYKAVQSNGNVCGGLCPYDPDDWYNYYWLFDAEAISYAESVSQVRPYSYGELKLPYATIPGSHLIIGGTVGDDILYIALANAGKVGDYDQPPLILSYAISDLVPESANPPQPAPTTKIPTTQGTPLTSQPFSTNPTVFPPTLSVPTPLSALPTPATPLERASIKSFVFEGAFRLEGGVFGASNIDYAVGALAYNPDRHSLFIVGHAHESAIAEYAIVSSGNNAQIQDLPQTVAPVQAFVKVMDKVSNPEARDRITGMLVVDGALYVNAETWYNPGGVSRDTTLYVSSANNLGAASSVSGWFEMTGASQSAGYMGEIPPEFQSLFGGSKYYSGWSTVYSGLSQYSVGPSFWTFSPSDMRRGGSGRVDATAWMNYDFSGGSDQWLTPRALDWGQQGTAGPYAPSDPLWNPLSKGVYGFFVPNSRTWCVIGSTAGLMSGIGYKAVQSNGNVCGGPCPYDPNDTYNYYWLYDVQEIASASNVWEVRPYAYGKWDLPYATIPEDHRIIGGTIGAGKLYVALANAGKVGDYDQPPLILTFQLSVSHSESLDTGSHTPVSGCSTVIYDHSMLSIASFAVSLCITVLMA